MKRIFIDANGWIALNSKKDQFHNVAATTNKHLLRSGCHYVTTNFVLDETYTGLTYKGLTFCSHRFWQKNPRFAGDPDYTYH